jgi:hypothetical protein
MQCCAYNANRVAAAIRGALDLCSRSTAPLAVLEDMEQQLRNNPEWREAEIRVFDTAIRRILARCVVR